MMIDEAFLQEIGLSQETFQDILALGWIELKENDAHEPFLSDTDVYRIRKLMRICTDFEVPILGGTIIVDLVERIAVLEQTVRRLKAAEDDAES